MRATIAVLAATTCFAQSPREVALSLSPDSAVELRLRAGGKLRGWIHDSTDSGFVLRHEVSHRLTESRYTYGELTSLKPVRTVKPSHTARNILIGVGLTVGVIGILVGVAVAHGLG